MEKAAEDLVRLQKMEERQVHLAALAKANLERELKASEDRSQVDLDLQKLKPLSRAIDAKIFKMEKPGFLKEKRAKLMTRDKLEEEKLRKIKHKLLNK